MEMTRVFHKGAVLLFGIALLRIAAHAQPQPGREGIVSVMSNVQGANVYCDSVFLGVTPILNIILPPGKHTFLVIDGTPLQWGARKKELEIQLAAGSPADVRFDFPADSVGNLHPGATVQSGVLVTPRKIEFHPLLAVGSGVGCICCIASAYLKIKADGFFDNYLLTGNRQSLRDTHRYDTMAGVTMALSQIGLAVVAYCLLSE